MYVPTLNAFLILCSETKYFPKNFDTKKSNFE